MPEGPSNTIEQYFGDLPDPRESNISHPLINIVTITICAVICGADSWTDVQMFGEAKQAWLSTFLDLRHGVPSHDTIGRVFRVLDPAAFAERFEAWTRHICQQIDNEVVAIDGKQLRGSKDGAVGTAGITMVNVWATENQLSLSSTKVDEKTNEITVIPELLRLLDIEGSVITLDAMGCQTEIASEIRQQSADYVLAVKGNQATLLDDLERTFAHADGLATLDYVRTVDKGHGRLDSRECWAIADPDILAYVNNYKTWSGLTSLVKVTSERRLLAQAKVERQTRYFISSLAAKAADLLHAIRAHWQVENSLHWVLDMAFREDNSRVRKDHAPQNFAIIRQLALNLLQRDTSLKVGINAKRKRAGWDHDYLLKILCSA